MTTPQPLWDDADIDNRLYGWYGDNTSDPGRNLITQYMRWMRDDYEAELAAARARIAELEAQLAEADREALAEYAHNAWAGWMKYMFEKGEFRGQFKVGSEGEIERVCILPAWAVERWTRQMKTSYADLPESEKESDRDEADKIIAIMRRVAEAGDEQP